MTPTMTDYSSKANYKCRLPKKDTYILNIYMLPFLLTHERNSEENSDFKVGNGSSSTLTREKENYKIS